MKPLPKAMTSWILAAIVLIFGRMTSAENEAENEVGRHHHHHHDGNGDSHFDFLMFTQIWPITGCLTWEDSWYTHTCTIDDTKTQWTIHGVWPTTKHIIGPSYCNDTYEFDPEQIRDLVPELEEKWTNVRDGTYEFGFWKHEWEKHGTCAMQLPSMGNEYLYFRKALELYSRYNVTEMMVQAGIVPGQNYSPDEVVERLSNVLTPGAVIKPAVNCAHDNYFENKLLYEVIFCFDKEFNLIGCEETAGGLYGSCQHEPMTYPNSTKSHPQDSISNTSKINVRKPVIKDETSNRYAGQKVKVVSSSVPEAIIDEAEEALDNEVEGHRRHHHHDSHFDFLMFTQIWPITGCLTWEDSWHTHTCTIDDTKTQWTIHGIWPTIKHKIGPSYCNDTYEFDPDLVQDLLPELEEKWTNVREGTDEYGFWRHEWLKHGTCAMQLPSMANEYLYFKKALELHRQYNVTEMLSQAGVVSGQVYTPDQVVDALTQAISVDAVIRPAVSCSRDKSFDNKLFYEVIFCFDKEFNLIGCEETAGGLYGSCEHNPMTYPDSIHAPHIRMPRDFIIKPAAPQSAAAAAAPAQAAADKDNDNIEFDYEGYVKAKDRPGPKMSKNMEKWGVQIEKAVKKSRKDGKEFSFMDFMKDSKQNGDPSPFDFMKPKPGKEGALSAGSGFDFMQFAQAGGPPGMGGGKGGGPGGFDFMQFMQGGPPGMGGGSKGSGSGGPGGMDFMGFASKFMNFGDFTDQDKLDKQFSKQFDQAKFDAAFSNKFSQDEMDQKFGNQDWDSMGAKFNQQAMKSGQMMGQKAGQTGRVEGTKMNSVFGQKDWTAFGAQVERAEKAARAENKDFDFASFMDEYRGLGASVQNSIADAEKPAAEEAKAAREAAAEPIKIAKEAAAQPVKMAKKAAAATGQSPPVDINSLVAMGKSLRASGQGNVAVGEDSDSSVGAAAMNLVKGLKPNQSIEDAADFDFLMITQIWPITSCLTWEDSGKEHTCTIDDSADLWTMHGVWPTKNKTIGPLYCNSTYKFDPEKIKDLIPQLEEEWTDVRNTSDKYNFWRHEWEKHGTCAMQLPAFGDEYRYFKKSLELHAHWNASRLLGVAGIEPGKTYYPQEVVSAVSNIFHPKGMIVPAINCAHDNDYPNRLFYEFIICIDKKFNPISCNMTAGGLYGSCMNRPMTFPDTINTSQWWRKNLVWIMFPLAIVMLLLACCLIHYMFFGRHRRGYSRIGVAQRRRRSRHNYYY